MKKDYEIFGKTLKTKTFEIGFDYNIEEVIFHDNVFVILLNAADENGKVMKEVVNNVYGVNPQGQIIWRIGEPTLPTVTSEWDKEEENNIDSEMFTLIHLWPEGIKATTFFAKRYTLDHKTGRMLGKDTVDW